ncbi:MAG: pyruvate kinase [Cytophagales bacterium]|nr:pyruvate kinase [Cytophagales bacterium]
MEITQKRSKIVATIGPASRNKETLKKLVQAGANVLRMNFSHGSHEDHELVIGMLNEVNDELGTNVCLLQDLQGPKIRCGQVENNGVEIKSGDPLIITTEEMVGTSDKVSTIYKAIVNDVMAGDKILIDDGNLELEVNEVKETEVHTTIIHGGILKSRKGINLPDSKVSAPSLTEKDIEDLEFGMTHDIEWVALSFVRTADDIKELRRRLNEKGVQSKIVAKIEKPEAIENMDAIIAATDAIMVARGDLGVEIPMERVPLEQKRMVKKCNRLGKPVIIATQMMESMITNPRPTRAETNDVANAIMDGADAVMLSAESASGAFPVEAVQSMSKIIQEVEKSMSNIYNKYQDKEKEPSSTRQNDLLVRAACRLGESTKAKAIVGMTKSGYTGYRIAMHRPKSKIYLFTNNKHLLRQISLIWGVNGFYFDQQENIDQTLDAIEKRLVKEGHLQQGDTFITTASMPAHWQGHTNMMKINVVE